MAALGTAVLGRALGQTTTEKSFRDNWSRLEDFASYGLLIIGLLIIPKTVTHWEFINCNYCDGELSCGNYSNGIREDPGWNIGWVEKLCSDRHFVQEKFLFSTYGILFAALLMSFLGNWLTLERARNPLIMFCRLLVTEKILHPTEIPEITSLDEFEALEVKQLLRSLKGVYFAHTWRKATLKMVVGMFFVCLLGVTFPYGWHADRDFTCQAEGRYYQCRGSPGYFLDFTLILYSALLMLHILSNLVKLLKLLPCFGRLDGVLRAYKEKVGESEAGIEVVYSRNRDLRILLELLHDNYGVAHAIAAMTLFDEVSAITIFSGNISLPRISVNTLSLE